MQIFFLSRMCLSLYDYQSKASRDRKGLTYLKNRTTTNQKHTIDLWKPKRREHKYNTKENHQTTKGKTKEKKGKKKKYKINRKTNFKMSINTYVSVITLNVNGLQLKDTKWQIG